jgi:hypothetical protein
MKKNEWIPALLVSSSIAITATYAFAQMGPHGGGEPMGKHEMQCPMMKDDVRVEVTATVENTAGGAIVRIQAKKAADAPRAQKLAQALAKHLEAGCPMAHQHTHHGKGHEHGK